MNVKTGFDVQQKTKEDISDIDDWQLLKPFVALHPQFKLSTIRWLLMRRAENGLDKHCKKVGRMIYINVRTFPQWIESL